MRSYLRENVYYIEDNSGKVIFSVQPDTSIEGCVIINTPKEVYYGHVDLIKFDPNI